MERDRAMPIDEQIQGVINRRRQEQGMEVQMAEARRRAREGVQSGVFREEGVEIDFLDRNLLEGKLLMRLPVAFAVMDPDMAALKYPSEHRPSLIFSDESGSVNITFNQTKNVLSDAKLPAFKDFLLQNLKRMQSSAQILEDGVWTFNERAVGYVEFISQAIDGEIYNLTCVAELEGRALLISFNCLAGEMELWQPLAQAMVETMRLGTMV